MRELLLRFLLWLILVGFGFISGYILKYLKAAKQLKAEKLKTLALNKKLDEMKLNIDRLTEYNSSDQKIRESAEQNIKEFKEAKSDGKVKEKLQRLHNTINNIYYSD